MARISSYTKDTVLTDNDQLIGTDANGSSTKNYSLNSLLGYIQSKATFNASTTIFNQSSAYVRGPVCMIFFLNKSVRQSSRKSSARRRGFK